MKRLYIIIIYIFCWGALWAGEPADSVRAPHVLREIEVTGVKNDSRTTVAQAVTTVGRTQLQDMGIVAAKGLGTLVPNLYMPDYGSRMTSTIYARGLGNRMDQPVVGLTVDNVPILNKDAYDTDLWDLSGAQVLRGAQSILNGRNTMGGQINLRTRSAWDSPGLRAMLQYGRFNALRAGAGYAWHLSAPVAMYVSGEYGRRDGMWRNGWDGQRCGGWQNASGRWKTQWRPSPRLSLTNVASFNHSRQSGYPYALATTGDIAYNDTCAYRRNFFANGLTVAWAGRRVVVTSVTSVQYLRDVMDMDQDFLTADYFTLRQSRREWTLTQDLYTRGTRGRYSWLGGVFGFWRTSDMEAPVTFKDTGIASLIEKHRNDINPDYPIRWATRQFTLGSRFDQSGGGAALYHQSSWQTGAWTLEGGLRADLEHVGLRYRSHCNTAYETLRRLPDGTLEHYNHRPVDIDQSDRLSKTYIQLLPRVAVAYTADKWRAYASFTKGYKAGGYNTQMFSDVLQQALMEKMGLAQLYTLDEIVSYRPEKSFNYELGATYTPGDRLEASLTTFYISCHDQQLTVFPAGTTTGRITTNAGRTRSLGAEAQLRWEATRNLTLQGTYGYTHATFRQYHNGRADFRGHRVPYAPAHTLFARATYTTPAFGAGLAASFSANARAVGRIWWNDENTHSQPFYVLPGLSATLRGAAHWSIELQAENITGTRYDVFHFVSMGNAFLQRGTPRQLSAALRYEM